MSSEYILQIPFEASLTHLTLTEIVSASYFPSDSLLAGSVEIAPPSFWLSEGAFCLSLGCVRSVVSS